MRALRGWRLDLPVVIVLGLVAALLAQSVTLGADSLWLVALGRDIVRDGAVPQGVPFTDADTSAWVNVPVLGELLFAGAYELGGGGLLVLQLLAAIWALVLLSIGAKRLGARPRLTAAAIAIAFLGALPALGIARAQAMSLVPFVCLTMLLRSQHHRPTKRIWLVVPLLVVWGNLHGAVLTGIAVTGAYLLVSRLRRSPITTILAGLASLATLWVTPAGLRSHEYYLAVLNSAAAERGEGLWARVTLTSAFDVLLIGAVMALLAMAWRRRVPAWEWVVIAALVVLTVQTSRHGVWLVLFLVPRAAAGLGAQRHVREDLLRPGQGRRIPRGFRVAIGVLVLVAGTGMVIRGLWVQAASAASVMEDATRVAATIPSGGSVIAPPILAEALAVAGTTVWAGNPLDAFPRARQELYLDFVSDPEAALPDALDGPTYVILERGAQCPPVICPTSGEVRVVDEYEIRPGWGR